MTAVKYTFLFVFLYLALPAYGQDTIRVVKPLDITGKKRPIWEIYALGNYGIQNNSNVWTASNSRGVTHLNGRYLNLGIQIEGKFWKWLNVGYGVGYKYEPYSYEKGWFNGSSFSTSWMTNDIQFSSLHFSIGFKTDILLGGTSQDNTNFDMSGINIDCFNKVAMAGYLGFNFRFVNFKFDVIGGLMFRKKLNVDKIAYYNMHTSYADALFLEIRFSYRLFTSGNRQQSPYIF